MTITNTELREHVETDLGDDALDRLIADAYAYCVERVGAAGEQTIVLHAGERYLVLPFSIAAAADLDISERYNDQTTVLVEGTDWRWLGGRLVERLSGGSITVWGHAYGAGDVLVTYTPKDDEARRDRVVIDLCKLAIQYNALRSETAGDYKADSAEYTKERDRLVRQLAPGMVVV